MTVRHALDRRIIFGMDRIRFGSSMQPSNRVVIFFATRTRSTEVVEFLFSAHLLHIYIFEIFESRDDTLVAALVLSISRTRHEAHVNCGQTEEHDHMPHLLAACWRMVCEWRQTPRVRRQRYRSF